MDAQQFTELVSRWVSGSPLAPAEEQDLLAWLESHPDARRELLEDETLDSLLRCWPRLEATADDFVKDCLRRAASEPADRSKAASAVAAPPVVAPPVVVRRDAGRSRKRLFAGGVGRWLTAVAGCSAVLLLAAIGWWLTHRSHPVLPNRPVAPLAASPTARPGPVGAFATLTHSASAAWETPLADGDRLAAGLLKLTAGTAELQLDKGTVARLTGPAALELRDGDEVFLQRGSLTARVPSQAVGFAVATPLSRIVDLGTEFDVAVEDAGATRTTVRQGRVSFRAQRGSEELGTPITLTAGALDHASVSVPDITAPVLPVTTIARGQGRFLGRLSANGKIAEFHTRAAFREFRAKALKQLREAPSDFGQKWPALADSQKAEGKQKAEGEGRKAEGTGGAGGQKAEVGRGSPGNVKPGPVAADQTVEVQENGKTISITDSKESGITVTVSESVGGKKKMTKVHAADLPELAKKNPEAHRLYRQHFHPRPKNVKPR